MTQSAGTRAKNRRNYYRILQVQQDAPRAVIQAAYRTMMHKLRYHPDLGGDEWNAALLNEAYAVLSNPEKRADYDRQLALQPIGMSLHRKAATDEEGSASPERAPNRPLICPFCCTPNHSMEFAPAPSECSHCSSPLNEVNEVSEGKQCRRSVQRMPHEAGVLFFTAWPQERGHLGIIHDISSHGMCIISPEQVGPDHIIKVDSSILSATARITNCRNHLQSGQFALSTEFLTLRFSRQRGTFFTGQA